MNFEISSHPIFKILFRAKWVDCKNTIHRRSKSSVKEAQNLIVHLLGSGEVGRWLETHVVNALLGNAYRYNRWYHVLAAIHRHMLALYHIPGTNTSPYARNLAHNSVASCTSPVYSLFGLRSSSVRACVSTISLFKTVISE